MTHPTPTMQWVEAVAKVIDQPLVDQIVVTAQNSHMGLGKSEKVQPYNIHNKFGPNPKIADLALLLVSAHHEKYDLVSIFAAALQVILSVPHPDTARCEQLKLALEHIATYPNVTAAGMRNCAIEALAKPDK